MTVEPSYKICRILQSFIPLPAWKEKKLACCDFYFFIPAFYQRVLVYIQYVSELFADYIDEPKHRCSWVC